MTGTEMAIVTMTMTTIVTITDWQCRCALPVRASLGQARARSLVPLAKARGIGMTH